MKKYLIAGLLVWVPLGVTVWVLHLLITTLDQTALLLPEAWRPKWDGKDIPGVGILLAFAILFVTGAIASNVIGRQLVRAWEAIVHRIPVVGGIYKSVKQISDPVLSDSGQAFSKAVLVEFPHPGSHTVAFLTNEVRGELAERLAEPHLSVYVPTTPNPTSGYMVLLPRAKVQELDMTVEQALKYVISMGVAPPPVQASRTRSELKAVAGSLPAASPPGRTDARE
ncbi:MAG: DUF502 domain-containing protein [Casimicrobiaceae bacterium]|nr:DUF502 domain-containing protein [Casimicrobiaceae bacterium]MCX8099080.1 DUF502 domain-containing protein [Casimicrobiaceae bacterium]MDW8312384.1 DUF502 domain-containing protein [Burkholderiales bacterium]